MVVKSAPEFSSIFRVLPGRQTGVLFDDNGAHHAVWADRTVACGLTAESVPRSVFQAAVRSAVSTATNTGCVRKVFVSGV